MLKYTSITALLVLLSLSSCKKQGVKDNVLLQKDSKQAEKKKRDLFSPISESEAKKFVDSSVQKNNNTQDVELCAHINLGNISSQELDTIIQLNEAKLSDVPIPLNSKPLKKYFEYGAIDKKIILGYISDIKKSDILAFYNNQMERLGWKRVAFFDGLEKLMIFKKPSKFCSISIRGYSCLQQSKQEYTKIVICTQF